LNANNDQWDRPVLKVVLKFYNDESGATAIEYGLIAALIAVSLIAGLSALGTSFENLFNGTTSEINNVLVE